jgi:trk system potassium uptake protein TrkH
MRLSRRVTPPRALLFSFLALIIIGAFLLMIPAMTRVNGGLHFIDAFFTATSAVCVTGLIVLDTGKDFTPLGQAAILLLIQLGGLGIMTFSVFFLRLVGLGSSLRDELAVRASLSTLPQHDVPEIVRSVILFTFAIEISGAILLFWMFSSDYAPGQAAWLGLFHAISAFCNAGFSLWTDNLTGYQYHFGVNMTIIGLIVTGGLGFIVLYELWGFRLEKRKKLSLHSKIVLITSAVMIFIGFTAFLAFEWNNILKGLGPMPRFLTALFQAVTPRTAGFNTIDFNHLTDETLLMTLFLMFIGGSPGSTAGGIKTVNITILLAMTVSRFKGFSQVNLFRRSLSDETVARGTAIILIGIVLIFLSLAFLLITETGGIDHTSTRDQFLQLLFETVSAFGTVGLSMGATGHLTFIGKVIIIVTMFLGRVGPLTVALAMMRKVGGEKTYNYGTEDIIVG